MCSYVDLNPFRAGLCQKPEQGQFVSLAERIEAAKVKKGQEEAKGDGAPGNDADSPGSNGTWLLPIGREDREETRSGEAETGGRQPMFRGFGLKDYLQVVDQLARQWREGKQSLAEGLAPILDRLGLSEGRDKLLLLMNRLSTGRSRLGYAIAVL